MRCLRKFEWVKLFRDKLPDGKGILGFWAKLAVKVAYRNTLLQSSKRSRTCYVGWRYRRREKYFRCKEQTAGNRDFG